MYANYYPALLFYVIYLPTESVRAHRYLFPVYLLANVTTWVDKQIPGVRFESTRPDSETRAPILSL